MKVSFRCYHLQNIVFGFVLAFFLSQPPAFVAQNSADKGLTGKPTKQEREDPEFTRWKIFLDSLAHESRTIFPEERRPYAMVEVANAYWEVDREASRSMYVSALDAAVSLSKQDKKFRPLLNFVLSAATRRDATLAKELNKRLLDAKYAKDRDNISSMVALDMLEENPEAAAQLAEDFAPQGLQDGTAAFLIFSLARKDTKLSDRLFSTYLGKVISNENIPLDGILALGGYSLGYSEYYSVYKDGQLAGASFVPIPNLSAKPVLTSAFLDLAFRRITTSVDRRNQAVGGEIEALNYPILFAVEYLIPEVAKFSPGQLPAWQQLQQQAIVGTTEQQIQQVEKNIQRINQARVRTKHFNDPGQTPEELAEASLENVEKVLGTCQRDVIYSKAALTFGSSKNSKRALKIVERIEDLKQSQSVKEMISISTAEAAIENGDFEEAQKTAEKIRSLELRAYLYVRLAQELTKKNGIQQSSGNAASEAIKAVEKLSSPKDRAGIYFSLATILLRADPAEAQNVLRNAIKNFNKQEPTDQMDFSIPIKVSLSCAGEQESSYGGFRTLPNSNVIDALTLFAKRNPDEASRFAEEIGDKITRIRSLAIITRIAIANIQSESKAKIKT